MTRAASDRPLAPRRIGVFGGAFDPPHWAHRAVAEVALRQLTLDELLILPTGQAWHKARPLTDAQHRLAMCRLAFADLPGAVVDGRETVRDGPTYTVDTLAELRAEHPGAALFVIMGADQWLAFRTWRRWQDILRWATVAVANRPRAEDGAPLPDLAQVGLPFVALDLPPTGLSATAARDLWRQAYRTIRSSDAPLAPDVAALVPPAVARYISDHRLYAAAHGPAA
ncbi:MAG: nicotinate (nicotinamide) nucleotide adenylyltransferase [Tepidimonas sp.]|uniref:nicotinate (nicotinamide) nucleotide adenylyltransferase n=1 Tax=Tepidimonas sp. TaxID=2002775 RepID=UPI00259DE312|nr:nicotinate (nicotinamide) nucleotide adenylyltransferase [Tepidimonas sp.]MDM7456879.1 nicotinate (nicotinamide) nucleotide adenylyltransferase [Tepidimonas sp.]